MNARLITSQQRHALSAPLTWPQPGWRLRAFTLGLDGLDTDIPEETCREVYEHAAQPSTLAHHIGEQFERIAREHGQ